MGAKDTLDDMMTQLDIKLVTNNSSSDSILPQYLIHTLVYFFLKTKNYKMARELTKHRRFVSDTEVPAQRGARAAPPTLQPALKSFS